MLAVGVVTSMVVEGAVLTQRSEEGNHFTLLQQSYNVITVQSITAGKNAPVL